MKSLEVKLQFKNTWGEKHTSKTFVYYKWHYPWRVSINFQCDLLKILLISCLLKTVPLVVDFEQNKFFYSKPILQLATVNAVTQLNKFYKVF